MPFFSRDGDDEEMDGAKSTRRPESGEELHHTEQRLKPGFMMERPSQSPHLNTVEYMLLFCLFVSFQASTLLYFSKINNMQKRKGKYFINPVCMKGSRGKKIYLILLHIYP